MKTKKFYNFARDEHSGSRELYIDGDIASDVWFGDECTPQAFKAELFSGTGDITVWINSRGGDVFAAAEIYAMLADYSSKIGNITAKIYGMCASAATVIAMAAGTILMSPTSMMVIHNPWTVAVGNKSDLQKTIVFLDEVKETILNAYEIKTGQSREKLSELMDDEFPMNSHKALEYGFCDGILHSEKSVTEPKNNTTIQSCFARLSLIKGGITDE